MSSKGVDSLDAPVSGGEVGAKEATLSIMVGGTKEAFQRALPIFQVMGKNIVFMGEAGAGQVTKACNQIVVGVTMQAVAEALTLARKAGVDPSKVREALLGGFAQSRILELHGKRMLDKNFQPGFKIKLHRKDLNIALQTGRELSVPLFTTSQVAELMDSLLASGKGELDHSALALLAEQLSGGR
jgi:2-hydroxy-3-oxopropionate reductase